MAHFAQLDKDNKVVNVIVIDNSKTHDENGVEKEELGIAYCKELFGADTNWVQTFYSHSMRGQFAGIGMTYDKKQNIFIPDTTGISAGEIDFIDAEVVEPTKAIE